MGGRASQDRTCGEDWHHFANVGKMVEPFVPRAAKGYEMPAGNGGSNPPSATYPYLISPQTAPIVTVELFPARTGTGWCAFREDRAGFFIFSGAKVGPRIPGVQ